jgi:chorismate synthase
MSHNTFGHLFRVTTWGESHGPALGCIVDGCPPGIRFTEAGLQHWMDKRKPGQSRFVTQRREDDLVKVLSGVMHEDDGGLVTTGTPVSMLIENTDQRSKDYSEIAKRYRPGHADYTYDLKYGVRDYRGGGRSSARETAARVAAGGLARKVVPGVTVRGGAGADRRTQDRPQQLGLDGSRQQSVLLPRPANRPVWEEYLDRIRKAALRSARLSRWSPRRARRAWRTDLRQARPGHLRR